MAEAEPFAAHAAALLGPRGWTRDPELLAPWLTDWRGRYTGAAIGLASPADTAEVAAFVRLAAAHRVPIVPQGGNSSMSGGATPDVGGGAALLSLRRLDRLAIDRDERLARCGAGVVLQTLHEAAAAQALRFPLTLGGKGSATVGGLISTNAGGTHVLRHGTMRAQVAGLEAVLADGSVLDLLAPLKKDARGPDIGSLMIGGEGAFGIVTAATLRLKPAVAERAVAWIGLPSPVAARALLLHCDGALGEALEGFEILPAGALDAVLAHEPGARPPLPQRYAWHALIETVGNGAADALASVLAESDADPDAAVLARSEAEAEAFWALRDGISAAERALGPAVQHDVSVSPACMARFVMEAGEAVEARFPGTTAMAFGHLGDGNVHFHVRAPPGAAADWRDRAAPAITRFVHDLVAAAGGSISAEHGVGQAKLAELERTMDPVRHRMLVAIKRALDPANLLNPGTLVDPGASLARERPSD